MPGTLHRRKEDHGEVKGDERRLLAYLGLPSIEEMSPSQLEKGPLHPRDQGRPAMSNPLQDNFIWKLEKIGKVTGSRVVDIVAKTKSGYSASRSNYLGQLVAQRLTGVSNEISYSSMAMDRGV